MARSKKPEIDWYQFASFVAGLYDEVDKLSKKTPGAAMSDLATERVNRAIRDAKKLLTEDQYLADVHEFVPAGNNPEMRDALLVLREIRGAAYRSLSQEDYELKNILHDH
jgi:hypothetical protein